MEMNTGNTFFLKDTYNTDIDLETNEDVLERVYNDNILPTDKLNINFAFVTDTKDKADYFAKILKKSFKKYKDIEVARCGKLYEIVGKTEKIEMKIEDINKWNQEMWDFGYKYDCKLDGWFVGA
jgi:hypothetical protein